MEAVWLLYGVINACENVAYAIEMLYIEAILNHYETVMYVIGWLCWRLYVSSRGAQGMLQLGYTTAFVECMEIV